MKKVYFSLIILLGLSIQVFSQEQSKYSLSVQATTGFTGQTGFKSFFGTSYRYLINRNLKSNFSVSTGIGFNTKRSYSVPKYVAINTYSIPRGSDYFWPRETYYTRATILRKAKQIEIPLLISYEKTFEIFLLFGRLGGSINFTYYNQSNFIRYNDFDKSDLLFSKINEYNSLPNYYSYIPTNKDYLAYQNEIYGSALIQAGIGFNIKKTQLKSGFFTQLSPNKEGWENSSGILLEASRKFKRKVKKEFDIKPTKNILSLEIYNRFIYGINYERTLGRNRNVESILQIGTSILPVEYLTIKETVLRNILIPKMIKVGFSHVFGNRKIKPEFGPYFILDGTEQFVHYGGSALGINTGIRILLKNAGIIRLIFSPNYDGYYANAIVGLSYGIRF